MTTPTTTTPPEPFTAEAFAAFWADPKPENVVADAFLQDVVGYWPDTVLHGVEDYTRRLRELLTLLPDLRLEVAEHADNGDYIFVRWIMRATGRRGAFELHGVDRIKTWEGLIAENLIVFDTRRFEELSGYALPF
jgi:hypothetical protein